ncbi:7-cyano-7-deazaguanine/7-aminomethyl-7-deazaguanine transporter [Spongorhabdus nitratireducens]
MMNLSALQLKRLVLVLSLFHIAIITASNYLVQIPFEIFGLKTTWGAFTFPFVFLATDLTVRIFGADSARKIIFYAMFPALLVSYLVSVLFHNTVFQGMAAIETFNVVVARIAFASFASYLIGQFMDITVFNRLRQMKAWWVAPACSTVFGNLIDTFSFFSLAFHGSSDAFMATHWVEIAAFDAGVKMGVSLLFFLPLYGILLSRVQGFMTSDAGKLQHQPA